MRLTTKPGESYLLMGPSAAGKSHFANGAAQALGGATVLCFPAAEANSYLELFADSAHYDLYSFEDDEQPFHAAVRVVDRVLDEARMLRKDGKPPRQPLLITDTISSLGTLAWHQTMIKMNLTTPPAVKSPEGYQFYSALRYQLERFCQMCAACQGLGMTWICTTHVSEKQVDDTVVATAMSRGQHVPMIRGGFRDQLPGLFDLVFHAGVERLKTAGVSTRKHYLLWQPDPKRATKSRYGELTEGQHLPNNWQAISGMVGAAVAKRQGEAPHA
jgi:hypothetical protein